MNRFIFLDLETTGLDVEVDQITEAAWCFRSDDDNVVEGLGSRRYFVEHTRLPNEWVLTKTDYLTRIAPAKKVPFSTVAAALWNDCRGRETTYLVGACIAFDDSFLRKAFRASCNLTLPYNYHVIDIEAMAMGALGHDAPCHLKELRAALGIAGENEAPHTALGDALEVETIWRALRAPS